MQTRFSKRAQRILAEAKKNAEKEGVQFPGPVQLFEAIISEKGGSAVVLLRKCGFEIRKLHSDFRRFSSECETDQHTVSESGFSEVIDNALAEAGRLGMETAGTAHLLLALLSHCENPATSFLRENGFDLLKARKLVLANLGESKETGNLHSVQRPSLFGVAEPWREDPEKCRCLLQRVEYENQVKARLGRADSPNVAIVGEKGAGKTSVLCNVVRQLKREMSPMLEVPVRAFRLELLQLVGWRWRRAQQKITDFLNEIRMPGPFIFVIDDVELFCGTIWWDEAVFFLRLVLSNSSFPVLLELDQTTYDDFIQEDPFLSAKLNRVDIPLPEGEEALRILYAVRDRFEGFHGIKISDGAVREAFVSSSEIRHDAFRFSCELLDQAASEAQACCDDFSGGDSNEAGDVSVLEDKLSELARRKQEAVEIQDYQRAAMLRDEEKKFREKKVELSLSSRKRSVSFIDESEIKKLFVRLCPQPSDFV